MLVIFRGRLRRQQQNPYLDLHLFLNIKQLDAQSVHGMATYMCDDIRDCIIQFCPPDDKHMCLKHVEA